jgi:hypothetical protein
MLQRLTRIILGRLETCTPGIAISVPLIAVVAVIEGALTLCLSKYGILPCLSLNLNFGASPLLC